MRNSVQGGRARHAAVLLAALCLLVSAAPTLGAGRVHEVKTRHYEVSTDVSERFAGLIAEHMESIYKEYERRFQGYDLKRHDRFAVRVFERRADYDRAMPPELVGSAGAFVSHMRLLAAFKEERTDEEVFRTLYHEGFHQFLYSCVAPDVPLWVNEGFAEYFSEATWNGRSFTTGQVPMKRLFVLQQAIRENSYIRLNELFAVESAAWLARMRAGQIESYLQYCEAWSVVHFLIHSQRGKFRPRLLGYIKILAEGEDHEEAFAKSFGTNVSAFERAWLQYVQGLQPGRDEVCRNNLEVLAYMALAVNQDPRRLRSLEELHKALTAPNVQWEVRTPYGERITSDDRQRVASLFKCPYDRSRGATSYVLIGNDRTGLPEFYCLHHRGVVMRAYYVTGGDGRMAVRSEQIVTATLPDHIARKLRAKNR